MPDRLFEVVAMGPELREDAKRQGKGINECYLLVHCVVSQAFQEDLKRIPRDGMRAHLKSRLQQKPEASA